MRVVVDLSEVFALTARAERELGGVDDELQRAVALGAAFERSTHTYQNRTGRLEASTRARVASRSKRLSQVDLEMGYRPDAPYASYLVARRLSNINSAAARVTQELASRFEAMSRRIAG